MATRVRLYVLLPVLFISIHGTSQFIDSLQDHPGKYRLDLPTGWKKPKLIETITDILAQTIDELKNRDFCTEGKAAYYVRLLIDSVTVSNQQSSPPTEIGSMPHYTVSFDYSFKAALQVTDSVNIPVSMLRLVSGEDVFTYTKQITTGRQNVTYRYENVYNSLGRVVGRRLVEDARAVNTFVPKLDPWSILTEQFMMNICEQKLYEIKKMLKQINGE
jgi:hypothetical protein